MTWQSASWEISLRQTTSVKRRNTGERRQVPKMITWLGEQSWQSWTWSDSRKPWDDWLLFCQKDSSRRSTPCGRYLASPLGSRWLTADSQTLVETFAPCLQEYENQSSPEARLVKEFDRLEMILQAHEYEELEGTPGRLQDFFDSTNGDFECDPFCSWPSYAKTEPLYFWDWKMFPQVTPACFSLDLLHVSVPSQVVFTIRMSCSSSAPLAS